MFDNRKWTRPEEYRVMTDQEGMRAQYFDNRQEAENYCYNQSLLRPGRWQMRSKTYGFEEEQKAGILAAFRPVCATLGCHATATRDLYQWRYCDACHARASEDETARRK